MESADGLLDAYKHVQNERGVVGVLVELGGVDPSSAQAQEVAHDVALHIASAAPRWVTRDDVPADVIEQERKIYESQAREEGKPEQAWPKIIEGKLNGFYKANPGGCARRAVVREGPEADGRGTRGRARRRCRGSPVRARQDRRGVSHTPDREERLMSESKYRRVVLKLSGEAFADRKLSFGIDSDVVQRIAAEVTKARAELNVEIAMVVGGGNIFRGMSGATRRHGPRPCRLHGHARDRHQRARAAGRARVARPADACADRDHDVAGRRAVHPVAGDPAPREGPVRDLRGGQRQPVLHDRHDRGVARGRDRRRRSAEGNALRRRRRLQRRPAPRPERGEARRDHLRRRAAPQAAGDGLDRDHVLHGQLAADHRVRRDPTGKHHPGARRRRDRHARQPRGEDR